MQPTPLTPDTAPPTSYHQVHIAGYDTIDLRAGNCVILAARLWVRPLHQSGHMLGLLYRSERTAKAHLSRSGMSSMLVRSGYAPAAPGVAQWSGQRAKMRETETTRRYAGLKLAARPGEAWRPSNQPLSHLQEDVRRGARATADADRQKAKAGSRRIKPQLPPRTAS